MKRRCSMKCLGRDDDVGIRFHTELSVLFSPLQSDFIQSYLWVNVRLSEIWNPNQKCVHLSFQVHYLEKRNVNVVIREERDLNLIRLNMDTNMAEAMSKGKEKLISASKG